MYARRKYERYALGSKQARKKGKKVSKESKQKIRKESM